LPVFFAVVLKMRLKSQKQSGPGPFSERRTVVNIRKQQTANIHRINARVILSRTVLGGLTAIKEEQVGKFE
jgi:hypothetical protein